MKVTTSGGNYWVASDFSGTIRGVFQQSTSLTGYNNFDHTIEGEIAGVFIDADDDNGNPYEAFAGGFNFEDSNVEGSDFLAGLFLIGGNNDFFDARLDADERDELIHHRALLVKQGGISFGSATHPMDMYYYTSDSESPKIGVNDRGTQNINTTDLTTPFDEVLAFNGTPGTESVSTDIGGYQVDWGYWDSGTMKIMGNQDSGLASMTAPESLTIWANVIPATDIASRSGEYIFNNTGNSMIMASQIGGVSNFQMNFGVDFTTSEILSGGSIQIDMNIGDVWYTDISGGTINDAFVDFELYNTQLNASGATGSAGGIFTGSNGFDGGFSMTSGTESIQGVTLMTGIPVIPDI